VETVTIRTTMTKYLGHPAKQGTIDIASPAQVENAGYAAHFFSPCTNE